ncbi:MAG: hypothetical protein NVS2B7_11910 [Herpetosiphon sp.]
MPDPIQAIHEFYRVVRPHGMVVILENDTLHHMLLPLPADLELALRHSQLAAFEDQASPSGKYYVGRQIGALLNTVGFKHTNIRTYTVDHEAPLSRDERLYIAAYLDDIVQRAQPYLSDAALAACRILLNPKSPNYLLDQPSFFASHLEVVAQGIKTATL